MATDLLTQLKTLHLYGMAEAWAEIQAEAVRQPPWSAEQVRRRLIQGEMTGRQARSLRYQLHAAKFPIHRDLVAFDWSETRLFQAYIEQLASAGFMAEAHNLILVGGTCTGKNHVATALGVTAIHHGKRVRFYLCPLGRYNVVDLVNRLEQEKQQDKACALARKL